MRKKLLAICTILLLWCSGLAHAVMLERVISREDPNFTCARAGMSIGQDGNVYLTGTPAGGGRGAYVMRVSRDGKQKAGGNVVWDGFNGAAANADGVIATANSHMNNRIHLYHGTDFKEYASAACGNPSMVVAGASGDFYARDVGGNRVQRINPLGVVVKTYSLPAAVKGVGNFRVSEAAQAFLFAGNPLTLVGFDGAIRWTQKLSGAIDMDPAGIAYVLQGSTLVRLIPDVPPVDLIKGEMVQPEQVPEAGPDDEKPDQSTVTVKKVALLGGQFDGVTAIGVYNNELVVKRSDPAQLFEVFDMTTGAFLRTISSESERVSVDCPALSWTAGARVPLAIKFDGPGKPAWRAWLTPLGDDDWRSLTWTDGQIMVPSDAAGVYQLRIAPTVTPQAGSEYTLNTAVRVSAPNSAGTVSVWTPLNRVFWGRGEAIPVTVSVRAAQALPTQVTLTLSDSFRGASDAIPEPLYKETLLLTPGDKPNDMRGSTQLTAAFTNQLAPGRYVLRVDIDGFTCVAQPIRIGPGLSERSPFRMIFYGDYANFNSRASIWDFADVAADTLHQSRALGFNSYVNRINFYRYPTTFEDADDGVRLERTLQASLAADPAGPAPEKVKFGFAQAHQLGAFSAHGLREWLLLVTMDAGLPIAPKGLQDLSGAITGLTGALKSFPAFAGWDWAANWWAGGDPFAAPAAPTAPAAAAAPDDPDARTSETANNPGAGQPTPLDPQTLKKNYQAALKTANDTGAWDPVLDTVRNRVFGWQTDAQQTFKTALDQVAPQLSTASSGPYRRMEVYPPANFSNVDEVDLQYQSEWITTPDWTAHATDFYKRPGKPAWIHPEFNQENGTGGEVLPFTWLAIMRGVDGIGSSGGPLVWGGSHGTRSVFRALGEFSRQYGPWLTTLQNHDRVAIVVSKRQIELDSWTSYWPTHFTRLWEAFMSCLYAHQPATFLYTEDVKPETLRQYKALLVVDQRYEPEPPLAALLAQAKKQGIALLADGTCRQSLVTEYMPLGISFDHIEKLHGWNDERAFSEFPPVLLANAPLIAAKLDAVAAPVAVVDQPAVLLSERSQADARYIWVVNDTPSPLSTELLHRVSSGMTTRRPVIAHVRIPVAPGDVVYDVFAGTVAPNSGAAAATMDVTADLRYSLARLYAVLPHAIGKLVFDVPAKLTPGGTVAWTASVPGIKAALPLRIELRDASGAVIDRRFTTTGSGTITVPINAAAPFTLSATELISGVTAALTAGATVPPAAPFAPPGSLFGPRLCDIAVSADGASALANSYDWGGNLYAINLTTGAMRWRGNVGDYFANAPVAVNNGFMVQGYDLQSAEGDYLYRLDNDGHVLRRFATPGTTGLNSFAVAPDGSWIGGAGNMGLAAWSSDGKLLWSQNALAPLTITPLLVALGDSLIVARGTALTAYEAKTGHQVWSVTPASDGSIDGLDVGADGRTLIVRSSTCAGRVFTLRDGKIIGTLVTGADAAVGAPDGSWVAITAGRELKRYAFDGGLQWVFQADDTLRSPRISPNGTHLAVGSESGTLYVVDMATGAARTRDLGALPAPAWTRDGDVVAATWMGTVARFDVNLQAKWQVQLAEATPTQQVVAGNIHTTRLASWSHAERTQLPLTPNLLDTNTVARD